jgi:hypothetical protein
MEGCGNMDVHLNDLKLANFQVTMKAERKIDRLLLHQQDGDDLVDRGRSSYEFQLQGVVPIETYRALLKEIDTGALLFKSPFGEFHVVAKSIKYRDDGTIHMLLVEDIVPDVDWKT